MMLAAVQNPLLSAPHRLREKAPYSADPLHKVRRDPDPHRCAPRICRMRKTAQIPHSVTFPPQEEALMTVWLRAHTALPLHSREREAHPQRRIAELPHPMRFRLREMLSEHSRYLKCREEHHQQHRDPQHSAPRLTQAHSSLHI